MRWRPSGRKQNAISRGTRQERIFLAPEAPAKGSQVDRDDLARVRSAKCDVALVPARIQECGDKETLPGDHTLETPEDPAASAGLHLDAIGLSEPDIERQGLAPGGYITDQILGDDFNDLIWNAFEGFRLQTQVDWIVDVIDEHEFTCGSVCNLCRKKL